MDIGDVPIVGTAVNLFSGITKGIVRGVNSSEHNFKTDLIDTLVSKYGVSRENAVVIQEVMDSNDDEGLGDRLRALIAMGVIPKSAIPAIVELADKNGVPQSSINTQEIYKPMHLKEAVDLVGADHVKALGKENLLKMTNDQDNWGMPMGEANDYGFGMAY